MTEGVPSFELDTVGEGEGMHSKPGDETAYACPAGSDACSPYFHMIAPSMHMRSALVTARLYATRSARENAVDSLL